MDNMDRNLMYVSEISYDLCWDLVHSMDFYGFHLGGQRWPAHITSLRLQIGPQIQSSQFHSGELISGCISYNGSA